MLSSCAKIVSKGCVLFNIYQKLKDPHKLLLQASVNAWKKENKKKNIIKLLQIMLGNIDLEKVSIYFIWNWEDI